MREDLTKLVAIAMTLYSWKYSSDFLSVDLYGFKALGQEVFEDFPRHFRSILLHP